MYSVTIKITMIHEIFLMILVCFYRKLSTSIKEIILLYMKNLIILILKLSGFMADNINEKVNTY